MCVIKIILTCIEEDNGPVPSKSKYMDLKLHFKINLVKRRQGGILVQNFISEILQNTIVYMHSSSSLLVFKPIFLPWHIAFIIFEIHNDSPLHVRSILLWSIMQTNRAACYCCMLNILFRRTCQYIVFHIVHYQVRSSSVYSWSINTWKRNKPHILDYCVIRAFFFMFDVWNLKRSFVMTE